MDKSLQRSMQMSQRIELLSCSGWTGCCSQGIGYVLSLAPQAHAQRGGSCCWPMSVEDLRSMSEDLELSRQQQAAIMPLYDRYMNEFEQLQDKQIAEVVDSGITMSQKVWTFGGGQISIPPRKDLEDLVENTLDIYAQINRIDSGFFDGVKMTLKIEDQLLVIGTSGSGRCPSTSFRTSCWPRE